MKIPNLKSESEILAFIQKKTKEYHALNEQIQKAESRARERTFGNAELFLKYDFLKVVKHFEKFTNEEKDGVEVAISSYAGTFPGAYTRKGSPSCTRILLSFKAGKWHVKSCSRSCCPKKNNIEIIVLPEKTREKVIKNFCNK